MNRGLNILVCIASLWFAANGPAQTIPDEYQEVSKVLGRTGDFKANVFKIGLPRNDLDVTVAGVHTPTSFGFTGWIAMTKGDAGMDIMMGDLVLLQEEVNPIMSALLTNGLEVTALHNHFFWEEPRIFFMHVHGHGRAEELARQIKPALDIIGHVIPRSAPSVTATSDHTPNFTLDTARIVSIVKHGGERSGSVYKITVGRDDLTVKEMGAVINARMGLNTWAAFLGTNDSAVVAGDIAMLENELTPVLKSLRNSQFNVVAIHHHMTGTKPMIIFLHYWASGSVEKLAAGFRAAMDQLGKGNPPSLMNH